MKSTVLLNKLVLFTVIEYLQSAVKEGITREPEHKKIIGAINGYKTFGRLSPSEAEILTKLGKTPEMKAITDVHISYVVFALELLKLWAEMVPKRLRPHLGLKDTRLKAGRQMFVMSMLKLKNEDPEKHAELKSIIDDSVITAKRFIMYADENL